MWEKVGIILNQEKKDIYRNASRIIQWLEKRRIKVFVLPWLAQKLPSCQSLSLEEMREKVDFVITLGGDGTIFRAAREFASDQIPLIGINLGGLGFLTEITLANFERGLSNVLEGKYTIENRLMLRTSVFREGVPVENFICLNDVVIGKSSLPRIINLKTFVNNELVTTYSADGLIISTPTGSTAYSLSAGGPVVHPSLKVVILSPICAHTLAVRPLIVCQNDDIKVVLQPPAPEVLLTIDGQVGFPLLEMDIIKIHQAPFETRLIRLQESPFFKVLRTKLGWRGISYKGGQK